MPPCPAVCDIWSDHTSIQNTKIIFSEFFTGTVDVTNEHLCVPWWLLGVPAEYENFTSAEWASHYRLYATGGIDQDKRTRRWYDQDEEGNCYLQSEVTHPYDGVVVTWSGSVDPTTPGVYTLTAKWDDTQHTENGCTRQYNDPAVTRFVKIVIPEWVVDTEPEGGTISSPMHTWIYTGEGSSSDPKRYRWADEAVAAGTPGYYTLDLGASWDPAWEDFDGLSYFDHCATERYPGKRRTINGSTHGFLWNVTGSGHVDPQRSAEATYHPGAAGVATIKLYIEDQPDHHADDDDKLATGQINTISIQVHEDHLARDIANLAKLNSENVFTSCHGAAGHAYNGADTGNRPFGGELIPVYLAPVLRNEPIVGPDFYDFLDTVLVSRGDILCVNGDSHTQTVIEGATVGSATIWEFNGRLTGSRFGQKTVAEYIAAPNIYNPSERVVTRIDLLRKP